VDAQLAGEYTRRQRIARDRRAGEEGADAEAAGALRGEAPVVVHLRLAPDMDCDLPQRGDLLRRQDEIVPPGDGFDALRQAVHRGSRGPPAAIPESARLRIGG